MKLLGPSLLLLLTPFAALALGTPSHAQSASNLGEPQPANASPASSMTVYVSDFDLDVSYSRVPRRPSPRTSPPATPANASSYGSNAAKAASSASSSTPRTAAAPDSSSEETPADRANALVNATSENLIRALRQAGYDARRLAAAASLPKVGVRIRGVFAEADEQNRARRLLVGGEPVGPKMLLFIGVNNLARPEQPLYTLANPPANDPRHGPVITVTSYAPAARFELSRDPSGEELQKIAAQIVADLTALLNANRLSLAQ
jgi:Domain of unknown function (DUF4410)